MQLTAFTHSRITTISSCKARYVKSAQVWTQHWGTTNQMTHYQTHPHLGIRSVNYERQSYISSPPYPWSARNSIICRHNSQLLTLCVHAHILYVRMPIHKEMLPNVRNNGEKSSWSFAGSSVHAGTCVLRDTLHHHPYASTCSSRKQPILYSTLVDK